MKKEELLEKLTAIHGMLVEIDANQDKMGVCSREIQKLENAQPPLLKVPEYSWYPRTIGFLPLIVLSYVSGALFLMTFLAAVAGTYPDLRLEASSVLIFLFGAPLIPTVLLAIRHIKWYARKDRELNAEEKAETNAKNAAIMAEWEKQAPEREAKLARLKEQRALCSKTAEEKQLNLLVWCELLGLHKKYRHPVTLKYLIDYLETGRCDTLKEALNLYEQELREEARDEAASEHRRQMRRQTAAIYEETVRSTQAAEQAALSAREAALWGEASTLVGIVNAANTKKDQSDENYRIV